VHPEREQERLFLGALDGDLVPAEDRAFHASLEEDPALRARFEAYRRAVQRLQAVPRERAPPALTAMVLRRSRRRRFQLRDADEVATQRVPAEVLLPLLLGALAALYLLLGS
jgi:anti-sigma factor RsiW